MNNKCSTCCASDQAFLKLILIVSDDKTNRLPNGTELTVILCRVLLGNALRCHRDGTF